MKLMEYVKSFFQGGAKVIFSGLGYVVGEVIAIYIGARLGVFLSNLLYRWKLGTLGSIDGTILFVANVEFGYFAARYAEPIGGLVGFHVGPKIGNAALNATSKTMCFAYEGLKTSFYTISDYSQVILDSLESRKDKPLKTIPGDMV